MTAGTFDESVTSRESSCASGLMASRGRPSDCSRLVGNGCASRVTNGADTNAASAERSSDMRSAVRAPSSANAGTVEPWVVHKVQKGTVVPSKSLINLLRQDPHDIYQNRQNWHGTKER